jgi:mannitol operon transcriptional antiterminator
MMSALTTRQRDLLTLLLESSDPLVAASMAERLQITPRQVNYGLKGLREWLAQRDIQLSATPGVGAEIICTTEAGEALLQELLQTNHFQLVLSIEQRRQLLALTLLLSAEPLILYQLQRWAQVSRTTILKDLNVIEEWLLAAGLKLERRPNYGVEVTGPEYVQRQAIAALLWGRTQLGDSFTGLDYSAGLTFDLGADAKLLPLVSRVGEAVHAWDVKRAFSYVAYAEAQLGGRFTDDSVRYLALVLAIQAQRVPAGRVVAPLDAVALAWLQTLEPWPIAATIARRLGRCPEGSWPEAEIAQVAMHLLAAPRNERWPHDLEIDTSFSQLIDELVAAAVVAFELPALAQDKTLHDGLITHVVPACLRERFHIWVPPDLPGTELPAKYNFEHQLAAALADIVAEKTAVILPAGEINNIALLLRAAYIRERPSPIQEVLVICPSGMATAQLLVARLKARFPRIGTFRVVSLRELGPTTLERAGLVITTVPLPAAAKTAPVIKVHPLLLPEDVEAITRWLAEQQA